MVPQSSHSPAHQLQELIKKHKLPILAIGSVLLLVIVASILISGSKTPDGDSGGPKTSQQQSFRNWLKPTSEIKVAKSRYVSPCQVLTAQDVAGAFGTLNPDTGTKSEEYLDTSLPTSSQKSYKTECSYLLSNTDGVDALQFKVEQFTDRKFLINDLYSAANPDEVQAHISSFQKVQKNAKDPAINAIITKLTSSLAAYRTYYKTFDESAVDDAKTGGLLLPGSVDNFGFKYYYHNVVYDFSPLGNRQSIAKAQDDGVVNLKDDEIIGKLKPSAKVMETIMKRAKDANLSQSPGPTILGQTDKYEGAPMLEACSIFDATVFKTATGQDQNDTVGRDSAKLDLTKVRYGKADKQRLYPSNTCTRRYIVAKNTGTSITGFLSLENMGTKPNMTKVLKDRSYTEQSTKITPLQTSASFAIEKDNGGDQAKSYIFQVGNYLGTIFISTLDVNGTFAQASREQQVTFINTLIPAIQRDAQIAK